MKKLRRTIESIPPISQEATECVRKRINSVVNSYASLGEFQHMVELYAGMTGKIMPDLLKKAMVLMAGDHGVAVHGVSAYPQEVTVQMIYNYLRGTAGANVLARHAGADMLIVDIGVSVDLMEHPQLINRKIAYGTDDFTIGPAMSSEQALQALHVGIDVANGCIDKGYNLFALAEMGIGNTTASAAIAAVFADLPPEKAVGKGSGIGDNRLKVKLEVVKKAIALNKPDSNNGLDVLCKIGGYDIAGLAGIIIGGAARRVPTFIDGFIATAAALVAYKIAPESRNYMFCSHLSSEPAHAKMLEVLGLKPILDMEMRLGEGTGAALGMTVLEAGIKILREMEGNNETSI